MVHTISCLQLRVTQLTGKNEVLAMVKQIGLPIFFMTLTYVDLHWNELISITAQLNGEDLEDESINAMAFFQRCT